MRLYFIFLLLAISAACGGNTVVSNGNSLTNKPANKTMPATVPTYTYEIVNTFPHDRKAFTQGLIVNNGTMYEGTGGKRDRGDTFASSLRKVEIESGKVLQKYDMPPEFFGEGITMMNGKIYQLTWQENTGFVYDPADFKLLKEFRYAGEGWGLTHDGTNLFMSDGTHVIRVVEPENFQTVRTIVVKDERGQPIMKLNELEYVKGEIWANVWETGFIARIDPASGNLLGRIDLNKLADQELRSSETADVLNGIAYDEATDRIFVTGKLWPRLYEIKIKPQ